MRNDAARGLLLVAGATFFWSLSGVFARWLPQVDPWTFNATRGLGMAVALLLWMAWEYRLGAIRLFTRADPVALALSAGFFAVGSSLYILALQLTSVAAASCIGATASIFAALIARLWLGERTPLVFQLAIVLAIAGVVLIALGEAPAGSVGSLLGVVVSLGYAFCFAGQSVSLRRYSALRMEPAMVLGGLAVFVVVLATTGLAPVAPSATAALLFMGVIQLAVPMVLYMRGAAHVTAVQMVLVTMADAVLNPLWVWLVHGEVPAAAVFWGGAVILLAIAVTAWPGWVAAYRKP